MNVIPEEPSKMISINVSGKLFSFYTEHLMCYPDSRLGRLVFESNEVANPVMFCRPTGSFEAIASLYMTGELHMPTNVCPKEFERELEYWGFAVDMLQPCCLHILRKFEDEQNSMLDFQNFISPTLVSATKEHSFREKVWLILDNKTSSTAAKIYLAVVIFFVALSILTLSIATISGLKVSPTKQEVLKYVSYEGTHVDIGIIKKFLNSISDDVDLTSYLYDYYYDNDDDDDNNNTSSNSTEDDDDEEERKNVIYKLNLHSLKKKAKLLVICEYVVLVFFTIEQIARLATCPSIASYYKSALNVLDTVILLLAYAQIIIENFKADELFSNKGYEFLLYFQMLRILRILRIIRNITAIQVLVYCVRKSYKDFLVLLLYISIAMVIFGSLFYFAEASDRIRNIPEAFWLCIITMTTVGYGDLYPESLGGKIVGGFCALTGVLLLSLIIPVFVGTFVSAYEHASYCQGNKNRNRASVQPASVTKATLPEKELFNNKG